MQKYIKLIIILLLAINIVYVFWGVIFFPLQSMDSIGIWFLKAKAIYLGPAYLWDLLFSSKYNYSHQQYPLLLPLVISLVYKALGGIKENYALLLYPLTYLFILLVVYKTLIIKTSQTKALLFTYMFSMLSPLVAGGGRVLGGNADIFIVLILWLIIFFIYSKKNHYELIIVFLIMIASQIKSEGIFLLIILFFIPIKYSRKIVLILIAVMPFILWQVVINVLNIPSDQSYSFSFSREFITDVVIILEQTIKEVFNIKNWYIFFPLLFVLIISKEKLTKELRKILLPSFAIMLCLYFIIYLLINTDTYSQVSSSFDRVLLQLSPILFMYFFEKMNQIFMRYRILK